MQADDWYLNRTTGNNEWHDGSSKKAGYINLGKETSGGTSDGKNSFSLKSDGSFSLNGKNHIKGSSVSYGTDDSFKIISNGSILDDAKVFLTENKETLLNIANDLQDVGDATAVGGYGLTLTGVGAEIGVPLAAIGNGLSFAGAILEIGTQLGTEDLNGAGTNAGFMVADKLIEKGLNKVLPGSGKVTDVDFNLDKAILTQGASLKSTAINRAASKDDEKK
jgi:hypothetical protein